MGVRPTLSFSSCSREPKSVASVSSLSASLEELPNRAPSTVAVLGRWPAVPDRLARLPLAAASPPARRGPAAERPVLLDAGDSLAIEHYAQLHGDVGNKTQCIEHLGFQVLFIGSLQGNVEVFFGAASGVVGVGVPGAAVEVRNGDVFGFQSGDGAGHELADRRDLLFAELARARRFDAGRCRNQLVFVEARLVVDVVEHIGAIDSRHFTDRHCQRVLQGDFVALFPLPMVLEQTAGVDGVVEGVADVLRHRLGVDQGRHVGRLLAARHQDRRSPHCIAKAGFAQCRLHDRQLRGGHRHAGHQIDLRGSALVREQIAQAQQHDGSQHARRQARTRRHRPVQIVELRVCPIE